MGIWSVYSGGTPYINLPADFHFALLTSKGRHCVKFDVKCDGNRIFLDFISPEEKIRITVSPEGHSGSQVHFVANRKSHRSKTDSQWVRASRSVSAWKKPSLQPRIVGGYGWL